MAIAEFDQRLRPFPQLVIGDEAQPLGNLLRHTDLQTFDLLLALLTPLRGRTWVA